MFDKSKQYTGRKRSKFPIERYQKFLSTTAAMKKYRGRHFVPLLLHRMLGCSGCACSLLFFLSCYYAFKCNTGNFLHENIKRKMIFKGSATILMRRISRLASVSLYLALDHILRVSNESKDRDKKKRIENF